VGINRVPSVTIPFEILGEPKSGGILIIADHASNHVPASIGLGINPALLQQHIAWDIGVADVARLLVTEFKFAAVLGGVSRLVSDLNRYADEEAVIPRDSDGIIIPGNTLSNIDRLERLERYYYPYHYALTSILGSARPALILFLHSFTPQLESRPEELRPWEVGVLYNQDDRGARLAIPFLLEAGLITGDQLPYSGKLLNATMNRHAEANGIAYLGIEMRQDLVADKAGQERFAAILSGVCNKVTEKLALAPV
jgi:predicted N-formylglutamate amidohydrolase